MFNDFDPDEFYEFSGDMDPNSIAGLYSDTANIHAEWDVGGVSGAETINSVVTVLFGDVTTASGTLASDNSQGGAVAVISKSLVSAPGLTVNGFSAGGYGTYSANPTVVVSASPGDTVRVSVASAFNAVKNFEGLLGGVLTPEELVDARLKAQYPLWPVNNAANWQHIDVTIPSVGLVDVGASFTYVEDKNGAPYALGFTAVIMDLDGLPASKTTEPIRLMYSTFSPTIVVATAPPTTSPTTALPTVAPTAVPSTIAPVFVTTVPPTIAPVTVPSTAIPTTFPPTTSPATVPPTIAPTTVPLTVSPTSLPPSASPVTVPPTIGPTTFPSTASPSTVPPTGTPTTFPPTGTPTTVAPTIAPTTVPPTATPTSLPPSASPVTAPPTIGPTTFPSTASPSTVPPTGTPTTFPPTGTPTTVAPTIAPATVPPTATPTNLPPTASPVTAPPTIAPTTFPSTASPSIPPTSTPSTVAPTATPTLAPTTVHPTVTPTSFSPTTCPTTVPPTIAPSAVVTVPPTSSPSTVSPTLSPTDVPPTTQTSQSIGALAYAAASSLIDVSDPGAGEGKAVLTITKDDTNVQKSSNGWRSFSITNTGEKRIAAVFIDVTNAIFPDVVFDDDGTGGDDVGKPLTHDWGTTETNPITIGSYNWKWLSARDANFNHDTPFNPSNLDNVNNLFVDALSDSGKGAAGGWRGELIMFNDFDPDEFYEFSGDMDPNSIAGLYSHTADIHAEWDVGGVSGAEMINSVVTVLFGDGTTASGTLASDNSQGGAVAVISNSLVNAPGLTVNGFSAGDYGTYSANPTVVVSASPGGTVRVSVVSAFNPVKNFEGLLGGALTPEELVDARLKAQYPLWPVNNAANGQHIDVRVPSSGSVDVGTLFQYGADKNSAPYALGFTAVVMDGGGLPASKTTEPIRLIAA